MAMPKLLQALRNTCRVIGKQNTIELLEGIAGKDKGSVIKNYIVVATCSQYGITPRQLQKKNSNKDENISYANSSIAFLLTKHCNLSQSEICEVLGKKGRNSISRYLVFINGLNTKFKKEAQILDKIEIIEAEIKEFQKTMKY